MGKQNPKQTISRKINGRKMLLLVLCLVMLFNYPILGIFDKPSLLFGGVPLLYVYIFGLWLLVIVGLFYVSRVAKGRLR